VRESRARALFPNSHNEYRSSLPLPIFLLSSRLGHGASEGPGQGVAKLVQLGVNQAVDDGREKGGGGRGGVGRPGPSGRRHHGPAPSRCRRALGTLGRRACAVAVPSDQRGLRGTHALCEPLANVGGAGPVEYAGSGALRQGRSRRHCRPHDMAKALDVPRHRRADDGAGYHQRRVPSHRGRERRGATQGDARQARHGRAGVARQRRPRRRNARGPRPPWFPGDPGGAPSTPTVHHGPGHSSPRVEGG